MRKSMVVMLATLSLVASGCLIWATANAGAQPGGAGGQPGGAKKGPMGFGGGGGVFGTEPMPMRWEYRVLDAVELGQVVKGSTEGALNKLGADGWELVAIEPSAPSRTGVYYFRRPNTGPPKAESKQGKGKGGSASSLAAGTSALAAEGWNMDLRIYPLKNASAAELADLLLDVLSVNKFPLRIAVDRRSNQLIVNGPMIAHEKIGALLNRLDMPGDNEPKREKKTP
jgi:hypothetical protein